jgi:hypothetical protein
MALVKFWFIRHKPTGYYLPDYPAAGITHSKPEDPDKVRPRAFTGQMAAQGALNAWLAGRFYTRPGTPNTGHFVDECIDIVPVPERKADEMEIVPCELALP